MDLHHTFRNWIAVAVPAFLTAACNPERHSEAYFVPVRQEEPAASTPKGDEKLPFYQYAYREGIKLDCYFTIEEMPLEYGNWIDMHEVKVGKEPSSIEEMVEDLSSQLEGIHVYQSRENPAVVHLVDARLEKEKDYSLDKRISADYSGSIKELVDWLNQFYFEGFHYRQGFVIGGGWPPPCIDCCTAVRCTVHDKPVRRALTDCVPLSQYCRVLWIAETRQTNGKLDTEVQYLGQRREEGRMLVPPGWEEPKGDGLTPFAYGEVAYCNNLDPDFAKADNALVEQAVAFIKERLEADKPHQVRWAMLFLGKREAKEGILVLLQYIDYRYTTCGVLEESYPAVRALTQIGKPAADAALDELAARDQSELRGRLLYQVVRNVNGYLPTQEMLEARIAGAKDVQQKKRVQRALDLLREEK
jgi:hypothetical protein